MSGPSSGVSSRSAWDAARSSPSWNAVVRVLPRASVICALLLPVLAIASWQWAMLGDPPGEFSFFGDPGAAIFLGHWDRVYTNPLVQAGPWELALYGIAAVAGVSGKIAWALVALAMMYLLLLAFIVVLLATSRVPAQWFTTWIALGVGALASLGRFVPEAITVGHPSQVVIPLLWVLAAYLAVKGRPAASGILIGLAAGWEVWGLLGAPVVLLAAKPRVFRAGLAAIATVGLTFLPFVFSGHFTMFSMSWSASDSSLAHLLFPQVHDFPWPLRLAQAAISVGLGCVAALLTRRSAYAVWLVPLVIVLTRLALDPLNFGYYWIAPATIALLLAGRLLLHKLWIGGSGILLAVLVIAVPELRTIPTALVLIGVSLAAAVVLCLRSRNPTTGQ